MRDDFTCQYCGCKLTLKSGSRDHFIPESKGGKLTWDNLVASCKSCQSKKANYMPEECRMFPTNTPRMPTLIERIRSGIRAGNGYERKHWKIALRKLGLDYILEASDEEAECKTA